MSESNPTTIPAAIADSLIGKEIDGCAIVKKIGQGGMGIVYLAEHTKLRQQYVVKILNPALVAAEDTVQRFFREAQSVARLNHPSIVSIQNVGQEGDYYYIRMEYVDGDTVENIIKQEKKLDWKLATKIVLDTADALSHAHKKGIIHRDIKPENIMFTTSGQVKVMDFGLAKQVQAATKVSVTGQIVGTPFFMSPEQAGGKTTDARSDIYSLGVTYYYLLTGVKPFNGKNLQEIFLKHFFYTPESPKIYTPSLPEAVCEIIRRCLKKKKERFQSAAELARDLRIALGQEPGSVGGEETGAPSYKDDEDAAAPRPQQPDVGGATGIVATGSDPAIPAVGSPDSGDLAAARAELGADDASSTVQVSKRSRPSLEDAPPVDEPPAPVDMPPGEEAAPVQRRERGARLDEVAAASLVFSANAPPSTEEPAADEMPPGEEAAPIERRERAALDSVPSASLVFSGDKPGEDTVAEPGRGSSPADSDSGEKFSLPDPLIRAAGATANTVTIESHPAEKTATKRSATKIVPLAVGGILLLGGALFAAYDLGGRSRCAELERRYAELQKATPPSDKAGLQKRADDYTQLAQDLDKFSESYAYCTKAATAQQLADNAHDAAKKASEAAAVAGNLVENGDYEKAAKKLREAKDHVRATAEKLKVLEGQKRYQEAAAVAIDEWDNWVKLYNLDRTYQALIQIPLTVTAQPTASKVIRSDGATQTTLGEVPASGNALVIHATPFAPLKLEIKHARFRSAKWEKAVIGYEPIDVQLERDAREPVSLGQFGPMIWGRHPNFYENVWVDGPFAVDLQAGALVFVTRQGDLRSVDYVRGRPLWKPEAVTIGGYGDPTGGPEILPGRAVFTAGCDGTVRALDAQSGQPVWRQSLGAPVTTRPRLTSDGNGVVVGTLNGDVVLLDALGDGHGNGKVVWSVPADAAIDSRPATRGGVVYAGSRDGKLRSIDLSSGKELAVYDAQDAICAGPVVVGERIYLGTRSGRVHALAVQKPSAALFVTEAAGTPVLDVAAAGDVVYFATANDLRAISAKTGTAVFTPYQPGAPIAGFALMNDRVAICSTTGILTAIDGQSGEVAWWFGLKGPKGEGLTVGATPVVLGEEIFVATREGFLIRIASD